MFLNKDILFTTIKYTISVALIVYLFKYNQGAIKGNSFSIGSVSHLITGVALIFFAYSFSLLRNYALLKLPCNQVRFIGVVKAVAISDLSGLFMIGPVGASVVKFGLFKALGARLDKSISAILFDRLLGLASAVLLAILAFWYLVSNGMLLQYENVLVALIVVSGGLFSLGVSIIFKNQAAFRWFTLSVMSLVAFASLIMNLGLLKIIFLFSATYVPGGIFLFCNNIFGKREYKGASKIRTLFEQLLSIINTYKKNPEALIGLFALSMVIQSFSILGVYFLSCSIKGVHIPLIWDYFVAVPIAFIANVIPLPMGGLGAGEIAFAKIIYLCRESNNLVDGGLIFLYWRFWMVLIISLFGLVSFLSMDWPKARLRLL